MYGALRTLIFFIGIILFGCTPVETYQWQAAPSNLMTRWAADIDPDQPWPEYPRPQMVRTDWINLNGLWSYQLLKKGDTPKEWKKKILVPYPVESALSGIGDSVGPDDVIWYRREFKIPSSWKGKDILLNFEAVDWSTTVLVNGVEVGSHQGGYDPFTFNISELVRDDVNELIVKVEDPTDAGYQPRGKQVLKPHGIWYTPSSGIWQTVWLEPVESYHILSIRFYPDPENSVIRYEIIANSDREDLFIGVKQDDGSTKLAGNPGEMIEYRLGQFEWWSPDNPILYDIEFVLFDNDQEYDHVRSYFGMRSISTCADENGYVRLCLNNEIIFQNGPLDQGFWPDGLYTPPTDEAMKYDIEMTKAMGFNMLRKHVKVESRRFYHWCDKLGIMVWQDMPSTGGYVAPDKADLERPEHETRQFRKELEHMILTKYNHPSIVMWVPFNEGWGQFDTRGIVDFIYSLDSTRLVNNTSGWADRGAGDVIDIHHYPDPRCPEPEPHRASVLGEFGGLGLYVDGHTWQEKNWGYRKMSDADSLLIQYRSFYDIVHRMKIEHGLAACVYTQTTDVETETNGLMTYDREVLKMPFEAMREVNSLR